MIPQPIDQVPLFVRLSQEERELVTARLHRRQAATGETIFSAGESSEAMFVITAGWIKLEDASSERSLTLANLGSGSLVGEIDTLLGRPYSTCARAASNTQLLVLSKTDLKDLVSHHPTIGLKFSATLGMRIAFLEQYLIQERLRNIELLSSLSESDLRAIAERLDFQSIDRGQMVVEVGAPGDAVFVIEDGQVRQFSDTSEGESYEDLGKGDIFGHTALITGKPYSASAQAVSDVSVWQLSRTAYQDLIRTHPAVKIAFSRVLAESLGAVDQNDAVERIRQLPLFTNVPEEALASLVARMVLRHFPTGEVIYSEGTPGDALYIVESGEVKLMDSGFSDAQLLERMRTGDSFGEMAILTGRTRAECARSSTDTTLWVLYKTDFDDLMVQYPEISLSLSRALTDRLSARENDFLVRHLRRIDLFSNLATSELRAISNKVKGLRFRPGEIICFAGQPAQTLFMLEVGEVKRIGVGLSGEPILIDLLGPGDSFGDQAIVQSSPYDATAQAIGDVELWTIAKDDFLALMEQYPALAMTVTRLMANRLSRTQGIPASRSQNVRGTSPMPRAPRATPPPSRPNLVQRGGAPQPGPIAPRQPQPRPHTNLPTSGSKIQRPQSGARPIPRQTSKPSTYTPDQSSVSIPAQPLNKPVVRPPTPSAGTRDTGQAPVLAPSRPPKTSARMRAPAGLRMEPAATVAPIPVGGSDAVSAAPLRRRRDGNPFLKEFGTWVAGLSLGAKVRATALTGLFVWFAFIAFPATAITTVSSAVGGLQIFNPPAPASGTPQAKPVTLLRTAGDTKSANKVAYAVATETPVPTRTPLPTATRPRPTPVPATRVLPTAAPAVAAAVAPPPAPAIPALPAIYWDQRLGNGSQVLPHLDSVKLEPANVAHGQKFWRVTSVKFEDITESGNDHTIYVKVLGEDGKRVDGKKAHLTSVGGLSEYPDEKPAGDMCDCNFNYPMYGDGYGFNIEDQYPSDKVSGMIMPMRRHVNYRIIFQLTTMP